MRNDLECLMNTFKLPFNYLDNLEHIKSDKFRELVLSLINSNPETIVELKHFKDKVKLENKTQL